mmetsp:Transcript_11751/g.15333  ORF Transcript_11751/g.15333 Transcript_11751/m.15333 type:complete len:206 (-) Transcript_11751:92-709(-)|eukprot:CAMPEP_0116058940 /NCGR_PEP_ID=MMETSP0322-20121206/5504_1 /TAXON_ID=163516 /ORGANISM="Leptocylindrus danicus var. apora, Strain B651" /LENGTH=205 /DNA_ID=CAMNT_0003543235 /DNA_START=177 /DNA_END=794 /DNA_ORIENTATION=+
MSYTTGKFFQNSSHRIKFMAQSLRTLNVIQNDFKQHRIYSTLDTKERDARTSRLFAAKDESGKSFDHLARDLGLTNAYTAQLLLGQARLTPGTAEKLKVALPSVSDDDLKAMQDKFPMRSFDDEILKEPNVYRTYEAITHYGEAIKSIINEQCGDGIMSAIDFYLDVGTTTGKSGEKRVVITFNGKFLPHIEQTSKDNSAPSPRN